VPVCDECGSRQIERSLMEEVEVEVCQLCGNIQGDGLNVSEARERIEARERGFQPAVYPLVKALESVPTFKVVQASAGRPERAEYPFVFIRVKEGGLIDLERLLTSMEMANRTTKRRWVVELTLQRGLLFIFRPRFWKPVLDISAEDIGEARADLPILARTILRDVGLSWWRGH
jgi:ribosomal protein L28